MILREIPTAGLEPAHPKITDFESVASTNSATSAYSVKNGVSGEFPSVKNCCDTAIEYTTVQHCYEQANQDVEVHRLSQYLSTSI